MGPRLSAFRILGILEDLLPGDAFRGLVQVGPKCLGQLGELGPQDVVGEAGDNPQHHGGPTLTMLAIGLKSIAAAEGQEEFEVPPIAKGEAHLDGRLLTFQVTQLDLNAFPGCDILNSRIQNK